MKNILLIVISCFVILSNNLHAQSISLNKNNIEPVNVFISVEKLEGKEVVKVI